MGVSEKEKIDGIKMIKKILLLYLILCFNASAGTLTETVHGNLTVEQNITIDSDAHGLILGADQDAELKWDANRNDVTLSNDLIIEDLHPAVYFRSTVDNVSYSWHYHPSTPHLFGLWKGTDDGTTTSFGGSPLMYFDDNDNVFFPEGYAPISVQNLTAARTLIDTDNTVICDGTFTVTLPVASGVKGKVYFIKNVGMGTITVDADGSETIDGDTTVVMAVQYESLLIVCDGSNWHIV